MIDWDWMRKVNIYLHINAIRNIAITVTGYVLLQNSLVC